ncbi:MAG TPA: NUDIX hydrolase, partial [Alicycliphilus sp.]|nr:NUDIX hydrolase [Alicycliphilus sp.]
MPNRWKPNVTVAAVVEREGRFLFIEENTADGLRLNNPAGHLDPGESPVDACVREVLEETAYDFTPSALVGVYLNRFRRTRTGDDITYLRFVFTGQLGEHHPWRDLDDGIVRAVWLTPDELRSS